MFSTQHDWQADDSCCVIGQPPNEAWVVDRVITVGNQPMVDVVRWEPFRQLRMTVREDDPVRFPVSGERAFPWPRPRHGR